MTKYARRISRLQEVMREEGAALSVLSWTDQMRYLTGFAEHGHKRFLALFVPAQGAPAFVSPSLNAQQARANPAGVEKVLAWEDSQGWQSAVASLFEEFRTPENAVVLIDDELYSVHLLGLQALRPDLRCRPADETLARLRSIKTPEELAAMQRAADLIDSVGEEAIQALREGMTEVDLQDAIYAAFKRERTRAAFTPLICFGANGAMPHHHSGDTRLERGDLAVIDIGCICDDYASDITRTVAFGAPRDPDAARVYDIVSRAHWAARAAVKPDVTCEAVDAAARTVIDEAGYGPQFMHRTGHGIGLSGHEPPYILNGNTTRLAPGMCFSIEPGIYLPGRFGVRIENIVTVTPSGLRSLNTDAPHELRVI